MFEDRALKDFIKRGIIRGGKTPEHKSDLKFVFVHGLSGWGSYNLQDKIVPYWGFFGGNVIKYLNEQGYECYGASVDPWGSAWDRACELYAQLAGKVVDYGKEHSSRANHSRFGIDFSGIPLMEDFENSKIVLIGHSFGGATVRLFSELLRNGSDAEKAATDEADLSDFFKGGHEDKIFALITLAAPTNGTTAYDLYDDVLFKLGSVPVPEDCCAVNFLKENIIRSDKRKAKWDFADYDMHIDNAIELNSRISTFDNIYYFSYPCSSSTRNAKGHIVPDRNITAEAFQLTAYYMSYYKGKTQKGVEVDENWQSNDGLVNEISARAPFGEPQEDYKTDMPVHPGVWYVMPTIIGDHMHLMGGITLQTSTNIRPFFTELLDGIIDLSKV